MTRVPGTGPSLVTTQVGDRTTRLGENPVLIPAPNSQEGHSSLSRPAQTQAVGNRKRA
jgi:hypothetical protein